MGAPIPIWPRAARVTDVLKQEEERFFETIEHGMEILESALARWRRAALDGETAFKLHDTYGFPLDLTADICRERGAHGRQRRLRRAMARQKEQARAAGKFKMAAALEYDGPGDRLPRLRHARRPRQRAGAVQGRRAGQ
jgi:alanyl-tRNA synthetase